MKEYDEQKAFCSYLAYKRLFFYATSNENNTFKQNKQYAIIAEKKAKATGKLKGVADLTIFVKIGLVYIEMKRAFKFSPKGKVFGSISTSREQVRFLEEVNKYPYSIGFVAYGCKDAIEKLELVLKYNQIKEAKDKINVKYGNSIAIEDRGKKHLKELDEKQSNRPIKK